MASEPAPSEQPAGAPDERRDLGDIRRGRPFGLARAQLRTITFRVGGVACLIALDICGLALALYLALALREVYYGNTPILWGVLWEAESEWLPFVSLVTVLVFSQARLYSTRERRPGFGRVVSSLFLVALLTFAFGVGIGHEFSTFGLIPTTAVIAVVLIGLFRASYDVVTREIFHMLGIRRRAVLVGEGEHLVHLYRTLGSGRSGIDYELLGVVTGEEETDVPLPRLGSADSLRAVLAEHRVDELIVTDTDFGERELLELVDQAHRCGRPDPHRAADDGAAHEARRLRARTGHSALRDHAARARRHGLGAEARLRHRRVAARARRRPAAVARDRRRREALVARPRVLSRPPRRARRAGVRDAEVPDDVRGRRGAAGGARGGERGGRARSSRSATTRV